MVEIRNRNIVTMRLRYDDNSTTLVISDPHKACCRNDSEKNAEIRNYPIGKRGNAADT